MSELNGAAAKKLKVFISYSRRDIVFAGQIVAALEARGLSPKIDTRDLPKLEDWRRELLGFIREADAVVFIVSPNSIASPVCEWEVQQVASLNKRLAPIVYEHVPDARIPEAAAKINYLFFNTPGSFEERCDELARALETDLAWIKDHTRLGELALRWSSQERKSASLLRGQELEVAERWIATRPRHAPEPTALHRELIEVSRHATRRRQRWIVAGSISVAVFGLGLAVTALLQRQNAVEKANVALSRQLAAQAFETSGRRLDLALLLNLQALATDNSSEVRTSLARDIHLRGPLKVFLTGHKDTVWGAAFSRDGYWVASVGQDKSLMLWDLRSPERPGRLMAEATAAIRCVAFAPDGKTVAAGDEDNIVIFAPVQGGAVSRFAEHRGRVRSVAYSPDGTQLASAGEDGLILIWNTDQRKVRLKIDTKAETGFSNQIRSVSFSRDGRYLVSGGKGGKDEKDGKILLWDAGTGKYIREVGTYGSPVNSVAFSQNGERLASGHEDGTVIIWDAERNSEVARMRGSDEIVYSVVFVRNDHFLASTGEDRVIVLWDTATFRSAGKLKGHEQVIHGLASSADGNTLASTSFDRLIILWDVSERAPQVEFGTLESPVREVSYSPDASQIAGVAWNGKLGIWDAATGRLLARMQAHGEGKADDHAYRVVYSQDGAYLVTGGSDGLVAIWDARNFKRLGTFPGHGKDPIRALAVSPDSQTIASGDRDGKIILWDVKSKNIIKQPAGHQKNTAVYGLAYSRDGKRLVSVGFDGQVIVHNASTGEVDRKLLMKGNAKPREVRALAIAPDGETVASGDTNGTIIVWSLKDDTKRELWHEAGSEALAYSADGSALVSAGRDRSLIVWNTEDYSTRAQLKGHDAVVYAVSFNPKNPNTIVSGGLDKKLRIWAINPNDWRRAACDVANRNLTCAEWQAFVGGATSYKRNCGDRPDPLDLNTSTMTCTGGAAPVILQ